MGAYLIDGNNLKTTYGVRVLKVAGPLDFLARKGETSHDWPDSDGEEAFTDSTDIYFKSREIRLTCLLVASSNSDFETKLKALKYLLEAAGTHTLTLPYWTETFTLMFKGGDQVEVVTKWGGDAVVGKFTLTFTEVTPSRATSP